MSDLYSIKADEGERGEENGGVEWFDRVRDGHEQISVLLLFDSDKEGNDPIHAVVPFDASHVFIIRHQSYTEPASADYVCVKTTLTLFSFNRAYYMLSFSLINSTERIIIIKPA